MQRFLRHATGSLVRTQLKSTLILASLSVFVLAATTALAQDWEYRDYFRAELTSFNQVPSVLAKGHGRFYAEINEDNTISFELSYADMSSAVVQAHIHFGASKTNGGVMVFLCGGVKPACPASGTITGTITAADVSILPATNGDSVIPQGIQPGDLAVDQGSPQRKHVRKRTHLELSERGNPRASPRSVACRITRVQGGGRWTTAFALMGSDRFTRLHSLKAARHETISYRCLLKAGGLFFCPSQH